MRVRDPRLHEISQEEVEGGGSVDQSQEPGARAETELAPGTLDTKIPLPGRWM